MLWIGKAFVLLASAHGNIVSPGLGKCMQVHMDPGHSVDQMLQSGSAINVEVSTCTDGSNQHYQIEDGMFKSQLFEGMCLTASGMEANANVHLEQCVAGNPMQVWNFNSYNNIVLDETNLCLDIKAGLNAGNTRETWDEIQQHAVVDVHLYTCHNPETTDRVNQLWTWTPFKYGRRKPHVVLVLADDLGWTGVGYMAKRSVQAASPGVRLFEAEVDFTPNLDKMATEDGVVLTRHYSYSSCTPSRKALMTGRLPVRVGVMLPEAFMWDGGVNKTWGYDGAPIPPDASSLAWKFKGAGYHTAVVGKVDGMGSDTPEHYPSGRGFDESLTMRHHGLDNWNYRATFAGNAAIPPCEGDLMDFWDTDGPFKDAHRLSHEANPLNTDTGIGIHKEELYLKRALDIIERHARQRPRQALFLHYASAFAHTPLQVTKPYLDSTAEMMCHWNPQCLTEHGTCSLLLDQDEPAVGVCGLDERLRYLAMVRMLDDHLGLLRAKLQEVGMWKDTVFVFTSDNGGGIGVGTGANNWPLRGGKGSDWEGGLRTVAFVSGGYLPESARGTEMNKVMHITDWHGTLLSMAGARWDFDNLDGVIGPVDAKDYSECFMGSCRAELRDELHLSPWALMQRQESGHWLKLITQIQGNDMLTGPEYPNNTDARRPMNPAPWATPMPRDCSQGCMFDLDDDPSEEKELEERTQVQAMMGRLDVLNAEQYVEPWHGCLVETFSCATARREHDGCFGPWIDDCPTCVNDEYFSRCSNTQTGSPSEGQVCVPRSTNDCNCILDESQCTGSDDECEWTLGVCDLKPQLRGLTQAQLILRFARKAESTRNFGLGMTLDS